MRTYQLLILSLLFPLIASAQFRIDVGEGKVLTLSQAIQAWDVVSFRMHNSFYSVDSRNDFYIRRGRIAVEGDVRSSLTFSVAVAYDGIAKDRYTPTAGSPNDNNDSFYFWNVEWVWSAAPEFNVVFGYFRPQVGREQMSSEFNVISFDKSLADGQPRLHLVGRSSGREGGVNIGGLFLRDGWSLNYNVGMFDPSAAAIIANGLKWSPLLTGRLALSIGDPELTKYKISYSQVGNGARHGVTIGLNAARQGATDVFKSNALYGGDLLVNAGPLDLAAEVDWMRRAYHPSYLETIPPIEVPVEPTTDYVYSLKLGWRFPLGEEQAVEPMLMATGERAEEAVGWHSFNPSTGSRSRDLYDVGVNWLIDRDRVKLNLHYVWGREYWNSNPYYSYIGVGTQLLY